MELKILELFCGTKNMSNTFKKKGHKTFTIDNNPSLDPDLCINILDFNISMIPEEFRKPDVIWASPPCTTFSVAGRSSNYTNFIPNSVKSCLGWSSAIQWIPKKRCKNGDFCHESAPRGSNTGTQGLKNNQERSEIPIELCKEIVTVCENKQNIKQTDLLN